MIFITESFLLERWNREYQKILGHLAAEHLLEECQKVSIKKCKLKPCIREAKEELEKCEKANGQTEGKPQERKSESSQCPDLS